jgi:DNA-binding transcriptional LysR family regulator
MLDFNDFFYFVQVVDRGGFTAASRTLGVPKSTLSHRIQQLEANLGVRLLNRSSRRFGMTDAGGEFYRHAVMMLREAELAETAIRHRLNEPTGTVRRLLIDDMLSLKEAAIGGLGIVALPGYVCRDDVQSGVLRQVLPDWTAGDSTLTALMPYRQGLLPSVRAFVEHLATKFPKAVRI